MHPEYFAFISSARVGSGGRLIVADEDVGRQTVKTLLLVAAEAAGKEIKFNRCPAEDVVFRSGLGARARQEWKCLLVGASYQFDSISNTCSEVGMQEKNVLWRRAFDFPTV